MTYTILTEPPTLPDADHTLYVPKARGLLSPGASVIYTNPAIKGLTGKGHIIDTPPGEEVDEDEAGSLLFWFGRMVRAAYKEPRP